MSNSNEHKEIGRRIALRRKELGYTLAEVAAEVGVVPSTIQRYEKGQFEKIKVPVIEAIASALHVNPSWLIGKTDDPTDDKMENKKHGGGSLPPGLLPLPAMRKIPRLGRIACGQPIMTEENFDGYDSIPESIHADFSLICSGDSMINARIHDGDIVYIRLQEQVENGEIAAVYVDGETTLKRVYFSPGKLVLQAENPQYAPLVYTGQELENIRIIGKAVGFTSIL